MWELDPEPSQAVPFPISSPERSAPPRALGAGVKGGGLSDLPQRSPWMGMWGGPQAHSASSLRLWAQWDSPSGMLRPSFCQVTLGRGTPQAGQGSSTSSSTRACTAPGSGFTTGEAAREQGCVQGPGAPERGGSGEDRSFWKLGHGRPGGLLSSQSLQE